MKLFGLFFHREDRFRQRTDDPQRSPTTKATGSAWNKLRVYATVVLIVAWLNVFRLAFLFTKGDHFGAMLLMKISVLSWFGLSAILQTAYYYASHTGKLLKVLLTLPVTTDCVRSARRTAVVITAFGWLTMIGNGTIVVYFYLASNGRFDYNLAPMFTYIDIPGDKIILARLAGSFLHCLQLPCSLFPLMMTQVLVYIFYHEFKKLKKNFCRALGKRGQFTGTGDLSVFRRRHKLMNEIWRFRARSNLEISRVFLRRRHQTLSSAVNKVDGFMMISNVGGFVCHIINTIVLLYSMMFYPDTTETFTSAFIYMSVFGGNMFCLFLATSAGIVVNHMVCLIVSYELIVTFKPLIQGGAPMY